MDFTLYVGSFFFPCYLVNTIEIFMRKNNVQMEVVPVDVNLGGHRSALICFSLQIVIFILCTLKVFYSYHSSFSVTTSGNGKIRGGTRCNALISAKSSRVIAKPQPHKQKYIKSVFVGHSVFEIVCYSELLCLELNI